MQKLIYEVKELTQGNIERLQDRWREHLLKGELQQANAIQNQIAQLQEKMVELDEFLS